MPPRPKGGKESAGGVLLGVAGVVGAEPAIDGGLVRVGIDVVLFAWPHDDHVAGVDRLGLAVDPERALALHDAEDLFVVVAVLAFGVGAPAGRVKAQPAGGDALAGDELAGDVLGP